MDFAGHYRVAVILREPERLRQTQRGEAREGVART